MCGVAGFVAERPDGAVLKRMLATIRHRGPEDSGIYLDENAGLGHARLSIIDVAGGHQPMQNEDGSLTISFNGEIFNYVELRNDLLRKGHIFQTRSDTEVILHLFEEYGEACVTRLNGQWAFAIWDRRRRSLFLSRDRMGVRPLFFTFVGHDLAFASEIKALLEYPDVRRELDLEALDQIFTFWYTLPPRTAFRNIHEIPPGHSATFANDVLSLKQYWEISYASTEWTNHEATTENQKTEELLALLTDATRIRLRSDVPVGAYLSGGLDSTLVAALAKPFVGQMTTFSVRFDHSDLDEGPYQSEAVRYLGTEHREIRCSDYEIGRVFPEVIRHTEKPIVRTAPAPLYLLSRLVHDSGYKVVLTGEGSDEMLGGYDIFKEAKLRKFCAARPESRMRPRLLKKLYPYIPYLQLQNPTYLNAFFRATPEDMQGQFFSHMPRWRLTARLKNLFSDDVKNALHGGDSYGALQRSLPDAYSRWNTFVRAQYIEARHLLPGYILSSQGDRVAMAHSVEGRFPYLDHRFVEFASSLPDRLKLRALTEKYLLKRAAAGLVPESVVNRPKQPYRAPDARSFFGSPRHEYVADVLSTSQLKRDGIFDANAIQKLVAKAERGDLIGVSDNMAIVAVLSTQLLIRQFITYHCNGV